MLARIHDETENVLNMQHITPNSNIWDYSDTPCEGHKKIEGHVHMAITLEKLRTPTQSLGVDN